MVGDLSHGTFACTNMIYHSKFGKRDRIFCLSFWYHFTNTSHYIKYPQHQLWEENESRYSSCVWNERFYRENYLLGHRYIILSIHARVLSCFRREDYTNDRNPGPIYWALWRWKRSRNIPWIYTHGFSHINSGTNTAIKGRYYFYAFSW